jgi:uncharacterized protein
MKATPMINSPRSMRHNGHRVTDAITRPLAAASLAVLIAITPPLRAAEPAGSTEAPNAAAAGKNADAQYRLGRKFLTGAAAEKDLPKALSLFREAADQGHAEAIGMLGYLYSVGTAVERDDARARAYFEKAAEKGSSDAQLNLGLFLLNGRGGEKDPGRGIRMMEEAVAQGSHRARLMLGEVLMFGEHSNKEPEWQKAYEVLIPAAQSGDARAQNMIGVILRDRRLEGRDPAGARQWFEKAARQGDGKACANLGDLIGYDSKDRATRIEALKWLIAAEQLNEISARYLLAEITPRCAPDELASARTLARELAESLPKER